MGMRRMGSTQRKTARAKVKSRNSRRKARERVSRDARVLTWIRGHSLPFEPWVTSWLCAKLDKTAGQLTQEDVDRVVSQAKPAAA